MSAILADPPSGAVVDWALVLVLIGALSKSAQAPFHSWLPNAMNAPTPVSAYLHSATMVKAGVYLVARFSPAFAEAGPWRPIVVTAGLVSMLIGGYRALRQHDIKLVLAYGTISQLGLMMVLFGVGTPEATFAGCALLVAHGPGDLLNLHVYPGPLSGAHLNDDASQGPNVGVFPDPFRKGLRFKGLGRHVVPGARDARAAVDGGLQDQGDAKVGKDGLVVDI
jgi:hypothetical protein